ncbi:MULTISPECIES: TetR/AcrR family transcriptional regulator [Prauserella salsuginis group]|uniref:TetR/AcrR family transcriptional regulator n=1 Tax=Prauserella salsuginis TaxID=387889 RepID=A0ABW6G018_9PSEU|nr:MULTISPECIES: TetR/AcrR family transcriptional regulator [Prauserella salsuginis group]
MSINAERAVRRSGSGYRARWEGHNSAREKLILRAAVELLEESSPGADIAVQQVAKRAGLAKSVVYRRFSDREDLDRRVRSYLVEDFAAMLDAELNISEGSVEEILTRSIQSVAEWMSEHPRLHEFLRNGPTADEANTDAVSSLKARMVGKAREIIGSIAKSIEVDEGAFRSLSTAVVTMVEGTLTQWVRDPNPDTNQSEVVADLATYAWYVLDGALQSAGFIIDPTAELVTVINQLPGPASDDAVTR